jgi:preprotein translocase SecE subunit
MRLDPAAVISVALFLICAAGVAWFVLVWQRLVDYLILTEAELRKVAWPTRRDLIQQTIVVIAVSASLGAMILLVDLLFSKFFTTVGVL